MSTINLSQLTDSQLETAIAIGEGVRDVQILEHMALPKVLSSVLVIDEKGNVTALPTKVKYELVILDDTVVEGETDAVVFVEVSSVGIVGQF